MKIGVIYTGGTIGSKMTERGEIGLGEDGSFLIEKMVRDRLEKIGFPEEFVFVSSEPYTCLSENMNGHYVNLLSDAVSDLLEDKSLGGIIITHGTDTLCYTAALLDYQFADARIPIVLVSSAYVITDPRANGVDNFLGAIEFLRTRMQGVYVSYRNPDGILRIYRGSRMLSHLAHSAGVNMLWEQEVGTIEENFFVRNSDYDPGAGAGRSLGKRDLSTYAKGILRIQSGTGTYFGPIPPKTKAILIETYHSGTICGDSGFKRFRREAYERKIPIFVAGVKSGIAQYETTAIYHNPGIYVLANRSPLAQYCKLWLCLDDWDLIQEMLDVTAAEQPGCYE